VDLSDLANLGEFLGGVAVIVSLVYLGVQIRQNTKSLRAATFQALSDSLSELTARMAESPDMGNLYFAGHQQSGGLSDAESRRFMLLLLTLLRRFENAYLQYRSGILTASQWAGFRSTLLLVVSTPGGRAWWASWGAAFTPEFQRYINDKVLQERGAA
jgi:hypothetical protein